ncbi:MAG: sigma-70 family RNA polymerase sigma factor [Clostridiales bacterium]|nr:sigma-70 family RNA polymerase sigma factor [Clostridiales bacterium]
MTYKERLNECLSAIKHGDETKYDDFVQLTYGPLINVARSYLYDKSNARSVVLDLYYKIYLYADKYDTSKEAEAYLWQIVKNKAYDYNKQQIKRRTVNIDDIQIFDNIDQYERVNARIDIERALNRVGATNKAIFLWTYEDGLTQEKIARMLGISKSAVCQRLNKTKQKLAKYLR